MFDWDKLFNNEGEDDVSRFRNIMNEWYAKDISRKVRSSQKLYGNSGAPVSLPPYGYKKDLRSHESGLFEDKRQGVAVEYLADRARQRKRSATAAPRW